MKTIPFTEFRQQASELISAVEHGETFVVLRHGKPVAAISPVGEDVGRAPAWKRPGLKLAARGADLTAAILAERRTA